MIGILNCGRRKGTRPAAARELYTGSAFRLHYACLKAHGCRLIFILSAKYGLIRDNQIIAPYELTVPGFNEAERLDWCALVAGQLMAVPPGRILSLLSKPYEAALAPRAGDIWNPVRGLGQGKRAQYCARMIHP